MNIRGGEYDGVICCVELDGAKDAYEVSLVAVPAQPGAGVVKRYEAVEKSKPSPEESGYENIAAHRMAEALQAQEEKRYGGM